MTRKGRRENGDRYRYLSPFCSVAILLPDADPLLGRQVHLVAGLDVERLVPGVDVADDAVYPIFGRAVRIAEKAFTKGAFADLGLPCLAVGDEEALVAGQAVDDRRLAMLVDV